MELDVSNTHHGDDEYKYDLHILCTLDEASQEVEELVRYLKSHTHKVYTKEDYGLGQSIFDAVGEGIDMSRYTMLWVTKEEFEAEPHLAMIPYFRQNALARLVGVDRKPTGTERILIALYGVSDEDFKTKHPEFLQFNVLCAHHDRNWKQKIEKVLIKGGDDDHDDQETNQSQTAVRACPPVSAGSEAPCVRCTLSVSKERARVHQVTWRDKQNAIKNRETSVTHVRHSLKTELDLSIKKGRLPQRKDFYETGMNPKPDNLDVMDWNGTHVPGQQQNREESIPPAFLEQWKKQRDKIQELEGTIEQMKEQERAKGNMREQLLTVQPDHLALKDSSSSQARCQQQNDTKKKPLYLEEKPYMSNERNIGYLHMLMPKIFGLAWNVYDNYLIG